MVAKIDPGTTATAQQNPTAAPLKCPRCDSTNTKFCYYNNYSLSQPRHFCKSCKRYWTRGGTLRNVPIGGGCRKNKRHKKPPLNPSPDAPLKPPHSAPNPLPSLPPPPVDLSSLLYGLLPRQPPSPGFFHVASSSHRSLLNPQIPASSPPVAAAESYSQPLMFYDEWELSKEEPLEAMNSFPASAAPAATDSSYLYWNQLGAGTNWQEPGFSVAPLI